MGFRHWLQGFSQEAAVAAAWSIGAILFVAISELPPYAVVGLLVILWAFATLSLAATIWVVNGLIAGAKQLSRFIVKPIRSYPAIVVVPFSEVIGGGSSRQVRVQLKAYAEANIDTEATLTSVHLKIGESTIPPSLNWKGALMGMLEDTSNTYTYQLPPELSEGIVNCSVEITTSNGRIMEIPFPVHIRGQ